MTGQSGDIRGRRIAIVEDEALIALDLEMTIEDAGGIPVGPARTVAEAIALFEREGDTIDGAILDVNLAGEEIFGVAERLHAMAVPFLFHTGHGSRQELTDRYPNVIVFRKPVEMERMIDTLARLMG